MARLTEAPEVSVEAAVALLVQAIFPAALAVSAVVGVDVARERSGMEVPAVGEVRVLPTVASAVC